MKRSVIIAVTALSMLASASLAHASLAINPSRLACVPAHVSQDSIGNQVRLISNDPSLPLFIGWNLLTNPASKFDYNRILSFFNVTDLNGGGFMLCQQRQRARENVGKKCFPQAYGGIVKLCRLSTGN